MKRWILRLSVLLSFLYIASACDDDDRTDVGDGGGSTPPGIVQEWNIAVSPRFLIPGITNRTAIGQARLTLFDDNTLEYTLANAAVDNGDRLTTAQINIGDPTMNGDSIVVIVNDNSMQFNAQNDYMGSIQLTEVQADAVLGEAYLLIASENNPNGLLRGQLNETIIFASDIELTTDQVVPPVTGRTETGTASLRITNENNLYYLVNVPDLDRSDMITKVDIHEGMAGANGTVLVDLVGNFENGTLEGSVEVNDQDAIETIELGESYVLVSSQNESDGLLRGQIDESRILIPEIEREWEVALSPRLQVPSLADRPESGTASLILLSDNQLVYTLVVNDLTEGDELTVAHIHAGNPVENGDVFITLADGEDLVFGDSNSINQIVQLTQEQADALRNDDALYVNIHSTQQESGLLRGQVDEVIDLAADLDLSPANQVPPIEGRDETGTAIVRLTEDNELYFDMSVNDLAESDSLTMAHIHAGAAGATGDVIFDFLSGDNAFDENNSLTGVEELSDEVATQLKEDDTYINIHSVEQADGLLRDQIDENRAVRNDENIFE
ncbi:CHRD domain-containing protein [Sediminitomix flava]|uniref:CHRD domain-containing protein n=1 Tax=Sediminitomix flava TaxID=379075 RepID=A0A315YVV4_SEDFL|nr:CHRD domain-containing protein [Sediminitomix flava]PWJ33662.1 CHRD domain-containing protein [Sediminitomix flava]